MTIFFKTIFAYKFVEVWFICSLFVLQLTFFRKMFKNIINVLTKKNDINYENLKTNSLTILLSEIKTVPLPEYSDDYKVIGIKKPKIQKVVNLRDGRWFYVCAQSSFQELLLSGLIGYGIALGTLAVPSTLKYIERSCTVLTAVINGYPIPKLGEDPKKVIKESGWKPQFNPAIMDIHS